VNFPASDWMARYAAVVNGDPEIRLVGGFFSCDVLLDFETVRYLVPVLADLAARLNNARP